MKKSFSNQVSVEDSDAVHLLEQNAHPLTSERDLDILIDKIGDARIVMLGEASHGTHEYYTWRSLISKRLITEKGFNFIAVEGDWPHCYKINRYVKHHPESANSAYDILEAFNHWPSWMWANWEMVALIEWLHKFNLYLPHTLKIGFYGLDVYSLWESLEALTEYLEQNDPELFKIAREASNCFEPFRKDGGQGYAKACIVVPKLCEPEVVSLLKDLHKKRNTFPSDNESNFSAEQNALVAVNAEKYYRNMLVDSSLSWNIRERHMEETLARLLKFHGENSKAIVWAHNTHIGDARAAETVDEVKVNLGQLVRINYPETAFLVGFGSYKGSVVAGEGWGEKMSKMVLPEAQKGSWESLLHEAFPTDKLLIMEDFLNSTLTKKVFSHRAVGVVYNPKREADNYVSSLIPLLYDAFLFLDETQVLHALHVETDKKQNPETYPFGI